MEKEQLPCVGAIVHFVMQIHQSTGEKMVLAGLITSIMDLHQGVVGLALFKHNGVDFVFPIRYDAAGAVGCWKWPEKPSPIVTARPLPLTPNTIVGTKKPR